MHPLKLFAIQCDNKDFLLLHFIVSELTVVVTKYFSEKI